MRILNDFVTKVHTNKIGRLFLDKKFAHYTWTSIFISILNIALLYLFIDILGISTIISSIVVIGSTFITRYFLFDYFKVL